MTKWLETSDVGGGGGDGGLLNLSTLIYPLSKHLVLRKHLLDSSVIIIFYRCLRSSAAATPVKYEFDN